MLESPKSVDRPARRFCLLATQSDGRRNDTPDSDRAARRLEYALADD